MGWTLTGNINAGHVGDTTAAHAASAIDWDGDPVASVLETYGESIGLLTALKVDKSTLDANTILKADSDDTPSALAVAASRLVGRKASGGIAALTPAEVLEVLGIFGPDLIVPPGALLNFAGAAWPTADAAFFNRFTVPVTKVYRYARFRLVVASGNIQVVVVKLSGASRLDFTRVMNSTVLAQASAPISGTGNKRLDLGATELTAGEYAIGIWMNNTTGQVPIGALNSDSSGGFSLTITGQSSGVGSSGTLSAGTRTINGLTLEADV